MSSSCITSNPIVFIRALVFTYPPNSFNYHITFAEKEKRKGLYYYIIYNKSTEKNIQTVRILYNKIAEKKKRGGYTI